MAEDGASALAAARAAKPGLVLLDVQLPDVDGFGVCEQLALEEGAPVVVLDVEPRESMFRAVSRQQRARVHREGRALRPGLAAFVDRA